MFVYKKQVLSNVFSCGTPKKYEGCTFTDSGSFFVGSSHFENCSFRGDVSLKVFREEKPYFENCNFSKIGLWLLEGADYPNGIVEEFYSVFLTEKFNETWSFRSRRVKVAAVYFDDEIQCNLFYNKLDCEELVIIDSEIPSVKAFNKKIKKIKFKNTFKYVPEEYFADLKQHMPNVEISHN